MQNDWLRRVLTLQLAALVTVIPLSDVNIACRAMDNALAECIIGLFKTEVINHIGPRRSMGQLEWATLKWVDWFNNERLLEPIGYITPNEAEEAYYANLNTLDKVA